MSQRFFVAPFSCVGEAQGVDEWSQDQLSGRWLEKCAQFLVSHGDVFDDNWTGELSHVRTKMTSESGAALVSISIHGELALSAVFLRGENVEVEAEVIEMFVRSMARNVPQGIAGDFSEANDIVARPLMLVVPFVNENVSEFDHDVARELLLHFGAAFLCRQK